MGKYSDHLMNTEITTPEKEIIVFGEEYISKEPKKYIIKYKGSQIRIFDDKLEECFKAKKKLTGFGIYTLEEDNKRLALYKEGFSGMKIYPGKDKENEIAKISSKLTKTNLHKYGIEVKNKTTGKLEVLTINSSNTFRTIGVFDGKEKEGASMICRIHSIAVKHSAVKDYEYLVEVPPNVDILFMIILCLHISYVREDDEFDVKEFRSRQKLIKRLQN